MPKQGSILVLGANPGSLGEAVADYIRQNDWLGTVVTAGVSTEEEYLDLGACGERDGQEFLEEVSPQHVICTIGVNLAEGMLGDCDYWSAFENYRAQMRVNAELPLRALDFYLRYAKDKEWRSRGHFVAISSNSAHIARRGSLGYCSSKAALSMGLRVVAREQGETGPVVYGYEPGLLAGTPMTQSVRERGYPQLHRMPSVGPEGLSAVSLARTIVNNLRGGRELAGCLLRMDGGEQ